VLSWPLTALYPLNTKRMEDDGLTLPPYDWAIEPQGLGLNVMTARTLLSDSQPQLVARVLNNSCEDKVFSADTFLSMAKPVQCLSDDGHKPASPLAKGDQSQYDTLFWGESASPAPPCTAAHPTRRLLARLCSALRLFLQLWMRRRLPAPPPLPQKDRRIILRACCNVCLI